MGFKETFQQEKKELSSVKRPYESVAFILFSLLVFQQLFYLFKNLIDFMKPTITWFSTGGITIGGNLQGFVTRIFGINPSSWLWVILGVILSIIS